MSTTAFLSVFASPLLRQTARRLLGGTLILGLMACSSAGVETTSDYKKTGQNPDNYRTSGAEGMYKNGSVVSDEGGFTLFGGQHQKEQ